MLKKMSFTNSNNNGDLSTKNRVNSPFHRPSNNVSMQNNGSLAGVHEDSLLMSEKRSYNQRKTSSNLKLPIPLQTPSIVYNEKLQFPQM